MPRHDENKGAPTLRSGYWQDLTTADFGRVDPEQTVALLPVAAVEQHGPHLPLATDALINEGLVRAALERAPAGATLLVLPRAERRLEPGAHELRGHAVDPRHDAARRWTDIGRSVARTGVRKLIVLQHARRPEDARRSRRRAPALRARHARRARHVFRVRRAAGLVRSRRGRARHPRRRGRDVVDAASCGPISCARPRSPTSSGLPHELAARNKLLGAEKPVGIGWRAEDLIPPGACGNAARADGRRGAQHLSYLGRSARGARRRGRGHAADDSSLAQAVARRPQPTVDDAARGARRAARRARGEGRSAEALRSPATTASPRRRRASPRTRCSTSWCRRCWLRTRASSTSR